MGEKFPLLHKLADDLATGRTTSRALVEESLSRIAQPSGEGARVFVKVDAAGARAAAEYQDGLRGRGYAPSRFAGIPFSVKDLFDLAGEVTTAGSKIRLGSPVATADAPAIAALKAAGFVVLGRTNMTEFAYSGLGLNPHYGTPKNIYDRQAGRIPGGSSSGAAVGVAEGLCALSIGSDTGGSCRIPAAYNGIVGFKPTAARVSIKGAFPLSSNFDSIGPLAHSVACCAAADALMAGDWDGEISKGAGRPLRLGILNTLVMAGLDDTVADDFARSVSRLRALGVMLETFEFDALKKLPGLLRYGGIVGAEALAVHREGLAGEAAGYDPLVSSRIAMAASISASDYVYLQQERYKMSADFARISAGFDAVILPAVANVAPRFEDIVTDEDYFRLNSVALRNTYVANFVNGCAVSVPMNDVGGAPTGLGLMAPALQDQRLFSVAQHVAEMLALR